MIGASNYTNYQMELLKAKFDQKKSEKGAASYTFEEWNNWRKSDGFMCRTSDDCNWIHSELYCLNANTLASKIAQDFNLKTTLPEISLIVSVSSNYHYHLKSIYLQKNTGCSIWIGPL